MKRWISALPLPHLVHIISTACARDKILSPSWNSLEACQLQEDSVMERPHYRYDFRKKDLNQIIMTIDLEALQFNSFLN